MPTTDRVNKQVLCGQKFEPCQEQKGRGRSSGRKRLSRTNRDKDNSRTMHRNRDFISGSLHAPASWVILTLPISASTASLFFHAEGLKKKKNGMMFCFYYCLRGWVGNIISRSFCFALSKHGKGNQEQGGRAPPNSEMALDGGKKTRHTSHSHPPAELAVGPRSVASPFDW